MMTRPLLGEDIAHCINETYPNTAIKHFKSNVWIRPEAILNVCNFLKSHSVFDFAFLNSITAVDYIEYFELVYHLISMRKNTSIVIKTNLYGRDNPSLHSVISVWKGADLQEREIWDLVGIRFDGHPNLKRVLLWEGFPGHPLRKDFIQ